MKPLHWIGACSVAAALMLAAVPAAHAHGAFAIGGNTADPKWGFAAGYSWNHETKVQAEAKAMEQCKSYPSEAPDHTNALCAVVQNFSRAWLVIAMDPDTGQTGFGYGVNTDRATAERSAMSLCKSSSPEERKSHCSVATAKHDDHP